MYLYLKKFFEEFFVIFFFISLIISGGVAELSLIIVFFYTLAYYRNKLIDVIKNEKIIFIFFISLIISSLFNSYEISIKGIVYFRFYLYFIALVVMLNLNKSFKILNYLLLIWFFIILDLIFQYITGTDIFGFESFSYNSAEIGKNILRLTGPFDDSRSGFYLIILSVFISLYMVKERKFFQLISLNFTNCIIISLTGERTSLIYSIIIFLISFFFLTNKNKKFLLIFLSVIVISIPIIIKNAPQIVKDRNINLLQYQINNFSQTQWYAHYVTSVEIFNDYKLLGIGVRNFRNICKSNEYDGLFDKNFRCSTHPHNKYLEILSESGVIALILIILIIYQNKFIIKFRKLDISYMLSILIILFILFDPLLPSKSFFNNWMACIFWFLLAKVISLKYLINKTNF